MSRAWRAVGGVLALAGLALAAWGLWWVPPAGPPPAAAPVPVTSEPPEHGPLAQALEDRRTALEDCLAQWHLANPQAPARVRLVVEVTELPPPDDSEQPPPRVVQASVEERTPGHMLLIACAEAVLGDAEIEQAGPGRASLSLEHAAGP